jgi:hypothetical protein
MTMADHRLLPERVDRELDLVVETASTDLDPAGLAIEDERHRQDRLERVALGAAVRCHIRFPAGDATREVEDPRHRLRRYAGAVVDHSDRARLDLDRDLRRDACLLAGVERIVDQLLEDHQRPRIQLMPGLGHQLLATAELEQAAGAECGALQGGDGRHHDSSHTRQRSAGCSGSEGLRR